MVTVSFRFASFRFVSFRSVPFRFVSFRSVSFRLVSFHFVSFRFIPFRSVSSRFVPFRFVSFRFIRSVPFRSVPFRSVSFHSVPFRLVSSPVSCLHAWLPILFFFCRSQILLIIGMTGVLKMWAVSTKVQVRVLRAGTVAGNETSLNYRVRFARGACMTSPYRSKSSLAPETTVRSPGPAVLVTPQPVGVPIFIRSIFFPKKFLAYSACNFLCKQKGVSRRAPRLAVFLLRCATYSRSRSAAVLSAVCNPPSQGSL